MLRNGVLSSNAWAFFPLFGVVLSFVCIFFPFDFRSTKFAAVDASWIGVLWAWAVELLIFGIPKPARQLCIDRR